MQDQSLPQGRLLLQVSLCISVVEVVEKLLHLLFIGVQEGISVFPSDEEENKYISLCIFHPVSDKTNAFQLNK